jgi:integrase
VLQKFSEFAGNPLVSEITKETIQDWRDNLRKVGGGQSGKGVSESAVMSYTIILRAFLNWAMRHHYLRTDPMAGMKRQTKVRKTRRSDFLTEDEREILLAAPAKDELRFVLHMGFFAGLRDGEIQAMTPNWIWVANDWQSGSITVQDTWVKRKDGTTFLWRPKGRKLRTIPMHPRLLAFLKDYKIREPFMLAPEKEFWPDEEKHSRRFECRNAMKGLVKRTSVRKLNYHILRHSFATHLVSKGVSLAQVAHLLGDTLKVTEENYAGFSPTRTNPLEVL